MSEAATTPKKILPMLLNLSGLSRTLGLGRTAMYDLLHSEQLPRHILLNGRRYWMRKDIEIWLEGQKK